VVSGIQCDADEEHHDSQEKDAGEKLHVGRRYFARRAASKATPTMTSTTPNIAMAAISSMAIAP